MEVKSKREEKCKKTHLINVRSNDENQSLGQVIRHAQLPKVAETKNEARMRNWGKC